jgi:hypothetical protein
MPSSNQQQLKIGNKVPWISPKNELTIYPVVPDGHSSKCGTKWTLQLFHSLFLRGRTQQIMQMLCLTVVRFWVAGCITMVTEEKDRGGPCAVFQISCTAAHFYFLQWTKCSAQVPSCAPFAGFHNHPNSILLTTPTHNTACYFGKWTWIFMRADLFPDPTFCIVFSIWEDHCTFVSENMLDPGHRMKGKDDR